LLRDKADAQRPQQLTPFPMLHRRKNSTEEDSLKPCEGMELDDSLQAFKDFHLLEGQEAEEQHYTPSLSSQDSEDFYLPEGHEAEQVTSTSDINDEGQSNSSAEGSLWSTPPGTPTTLDAAWQLYCLDHDIDSQPDAVLSLLIPEARQAAAAQALLLPLPPGPLVEPETPAACDICGRYLRAYLAKPCQICTKKQPCVWSVMWSEPRVCNATGTIPGIPAAMKALVDMVFNTSGPTASSKGGNGPFLRVGCRLSEQADAQADILFYTAAFWKQKTRSPLHSAAVGFGGELKPIDENDDAFGWGLTLERSDPIGVCNHVGVEPTDVTAELLLAMGHTSGAWEWRPGGETWKAGCIPPCKRYAHQNGWVFWEMGEPRQSKKASHKRPDSSRAHVDHQNGITTSIGGSTSGVSDGGAALSLK
jgi:hypothetical protein